MVNKSRDEEGLRQVEAGVDDEHSVRVPSLDAAWVQPLYFCSGQFPESVITLENALVLVNLQQISQPLVKPQTPATNNRQLSCSWC